MENKYTGEVPLKIGDQDGILVFDWAALAAVKSQISQAEMDNLAQLAPDKLAIMAACGFKKKSPHLTLEVIMAASPPIMEVATAIDRALLFAYHGPEAARQILEPIDKAVDDFEKSTAKESKKKSPAKTK
jgi:hypothetical protein